MINKFINRISLKENKRRYFILKGIKNRSYAYKGPDIVQIDLTNKCNSSCSICWLHSPFIQHQEDIEAELDINVVKCFLDSLLKTGVREVIFSGGGEPFLFSNIWDVLEYVNRIGLIFRVNTNFTLLDDTDIRRLVSFKNMASLTISIWSGDADVYSSIHNRNHDVFLKVKNNLRLINKLKLSRLEVRLFAVINNINYMNLESIIGLASDTGSTVVEFGILDVIHGGTDKFLLNNEQLGVLEENFRKISRNQMHIRIANKELFLRRVTNSRASLGEYDTHVKVLPCYAGWLFLRLRANGDFNSCLKSHRLPLGNIYKDDYRSIWNGELQRNFREKCLQLPRDRDYFKFMGNSCGDDIGCSYVCDNIVVNEGIHKFVRHI